MRTLITGAGGFIGSHLMDALPDAVGVDNFLTGRRENHAGVFELDITDRQKLYAFANQIEPTLVIHCAASYNDPNLWHRDTDTNVMGAINVAAVATHHRSRLVYFQTVLPPISSYAISKIAGEHYLRLSGQPLTVYRLAAVYGPRNLSGPIPTFYKRITSGEMCTAVKDTTRDFVFVGDLVQRVLDDLEQRTGTFDIGTAEQTEISELPWIISELLEEIPRVQLRDRAPDDVARYDMDPSPWPGERTTLEEGLAQTIAWYVENGVGETYTHLTLKG